jgi:N-acetylneuraminic acid mutarotase
MARRPLFVLILLVASCTACSARNTHVAPMAAGLRWEHHASAPTPRTEVTAAAVDGLVYVAGGFVEDGSTTDRVEVYDTGSDSWSSGPPLPLAVNHAMSAALDGTVYVFGGYRSGLSDPSDRAFALRDGAWVEVQRMPEPRAAGGAAPASGRIYVAGGIGPGGLAAGMLVFDPALGWSTAPGLGSPREHLGVAGYADRIYVVGGRAPANLAYADVYDPSTLSWKGLPAMPTPRGGLAAAATGNGFVVAPGGEADATFDEAEAFDTAAGTWASLPPMPTARHGLGVVAVRCRVYVIAGGPKPGFAFSGAVESIDLAPLRACPGGE